MFIADSHILCIFGGVNEASMLRARLLEPMPEARLKKDLKLRECYIFPKNTTQRMKLI